MADLAGFPARREASEARGLLRGFGVGNYVENDGGARFVMTVPQPALPAMARRALE